MWHPQEGNFTGNTQDTNLTNLFEKNTYSTHSHIIQGPVSKIGGDELNKHFDSVILATVLKFIFYQFLFIWFNNIFEILFLCIPLLDTEFL